MWQKPRLRLETFFLCVVSFEIYDLVLKRFKIYPCPGQTTIWKWNNFVTFNLFIRSFLAGVFDVDRFLNWTWICPLISSLKGSVSSGDLPAVCQSEAVIPQPLAHFPQQLPVKPQGQSPSRCHSHVFAFWITFGIFQNKTKGRRNRLSSKTVPLGTILTKQIPLTQHRTSLSVLLRLTARISLWFASPKGKEGRQIAEWLIGAHKGSC